MRISDWSSDVCSSDLKVAAALFKRLDKMKQTKSPFAKKLTAEAARQVVFVRPELVAEVEFRAWTADGSVRHAAYRGLRDDKAPEEVVRESATAAKGKEAGKAAPAIRLTHPDRRSEEHTSELQSQLRTSYAVFCLKN